MPEPRPGTPVLSSGSHRTRSRFAGTGLGEQLEEPAEDLDPTPQLLQVQLLVGGMQTIVRHTDSGENDRSAGQAELRYDGNRAPGTDLDRLLSHHGFKGLVQDLERGCADIHFHWVATVQQAHLDVGPRGSRCRNRTRQSLADLLELLAGYQPKADLGRGLRRDDGLGPLTHKSALDPVDLERRKGPHPLENGAIAQSGENPAGDLTAHESLLVEGEPLPGGQLGVGGGLDRLIQSGNLDLARLRLELTEYPGQRFNRVRGDTAVGTGMQVALESANRNLGVAESPQRGVHRRQS